MVILTIDKTQGVLLSPPEIVTRGFVDLDKDKEMLAKASEIVIAAITQQDEHRVDSSLIDETVRATLRKFIYNETRQNPVIIPVVIEI